jgi:hypothetical protein
VVDERALLELPTAVIQFLEMTGARGGSSSSLGHYPCRELGGVNRAVGFDRNLPGDNVGRKRC